MLWESLKDLDFDLSHVITKFGSSVIMIGLSLYQDEWTLLWNHKSEKKKNELANFRFLDSRSLEVNFMQ